MTSREELNRYTLGVARVVQAARAELDSLLAGIAGLPPEQARDELLEALPVITDQYGAIVADAAAELYEKQRAAEIGGRFYAEVGRTASIEAVQGTVRAAAGGLWRDNPERVGRMLTGAVQRYIANVGRRTMALNARRDAKRPVYARVPHGEKTCAWCLILASRGWQAASREHEVESHYHDDCDCQVVCSWQRGTPRLDGYDPDGLYEMYQAAREDSGSGDPSVIAARMRRLYPDAVTDGVRA